MSEFHSAKKEGRLDFKQIILGHFKRILELSCSEFCGGYWNYIFNGNVKTQVYVTDKRKEFVQAVEMLALALKPHFDKGDKDNNGMEEDYGEYEDKLKDLDKEYKNKKKEEDKIEYSKKHLELIKTLFNKISCLLKRLDYFKTEFYSEEEGLTEVDE
jgi:hypothetical protein